MLTNQDHLLPYFFVHFPPLSVVSVIDILVIENYLDIGIWLLEFRLIGQSHFIAQYYNIALV